MGQLGRDLHPKSSPILENFIFGMGKGEVMRVRRWTCRGMQRKMGETDVWEKGCITGIRVCKGGKKWEEKGAVEQNRRDNEGCRGSDNKRKRRESILTTLKPAETVWSSDDAGRREECYEAWTIHYIFFLSIWIRFSGFWKKLAHTTNLEWAVCV